MLGWRTYCLDDIVNQFLGFVHLFFGIGHDQAVQVFVLVTRVSSVRLALALFDGAFAADSNLGARFIFHLFQRVATRSNEEADC